MILRQTTTTHLVRFISWTYTSNVSLMLDTIGYASVSISHAITARLTHGTVAAASKPLPAILPDEGEPASLFQVGAGRKSPASGR